MAEVCHKPDDIWKLEHKRSNVWLHFLVNKSKKDNLSQAKCVYCGQILTIPNAGTTTSLRFHLLAKNQHGGKTIDMNVNPLISRLKPETLDTLCFLRAHLQNK